MSFCWIWHWPISWGSLLMTLWCLWGESATTSHLTQLQYLQVSHWSPVVRLKIKFRIEENIVKYDIIVKLMTKLSKWWHNCQIDDIIVKLMAKLSNWWQNCLIDGQIVISMTALSNWSYYYNWANCQINKKLSDSENCEIAEQIVR